MSNRLLSKKIYNSCLKMKQQRGFTIELNGITYFGKLITEGNLIAELVGPKVCKLFHLDSCVNYPVFSESNDRQYILSESIYKPNYVYDYFYKIFGYRHGEVSINSFPLMTIFYANFRNMDQLIHDLLRLLFRTYYMKNVDVHYHNFMVMLDQSSISLAPLFDFEADCCEGLYSKNNYFIFEINRLKEYLELYPEINDILGIIYSIDINKVIQEVCEEYGLTVDSDIRNRFILKSDDSKRTIDHIMSH